MHDHICYDLGGDTACRLARRRGETGAGRSGRCPVGVTWQGAGGAGGALPPLFTTATAAFRVAESQALNTSGGT